jgi:hypothetical protein
MAGILESLTAGLTIIQYDDWQIFVKRLNKAIQAGAIKEVPVLRPGYRGRGEQWFSDPESGEIYSYVSPNPPVYPRWERVDVFELLNPIVPPPLSRFKIGTMSVMTAHIMKLQLEEFVHRGLIEELPGPFSSMLRAHETERRFRDLESNLVYRLTEYYALSGPDEMRWGVVPSGELSEKIQ